MIIGGLGNWHTIPLSSKIDEIPIFSWQDIEKAHHSKPDRWAILPEIETLKAKAKGRSALFATYCDEH